MTRLDADLDRFVARLRQRLVRGADIFGDTSFTRAAAEFTNEDQQALGGVSGWPLRDPLRCDRVRQSDGGLCEKGEEHG